MWGSCYRKRLFALGAAICAIDSALGDNMVFVNAGIAWQDSLGLYSAVNSESPGCCMCFNYWETWNEVKPDNSYITFTSWATGELCTVFRDGVAIATVPCSGDPSWFSDYDVVPGETYTYEIVGARGGRTGEIKVECKFIYRLDPAEPALSFAANDNYSNGKYAATLYKQTASALTAVDYPWSVGCESSVKENGDWIGAECGYDGRIYVWVSPNETGSARIGQATIKVGGMGLPITVTQAGKVTGYFSWAAENGVVGAWNEKSGGVYNVFRYVFGQRTGDFAVLTGIDVGESNVVITTPSVANSDGVVVSVVESSDLEGTTVITSKALDAAGRTEFTKSAEAPRYYRLKADVIETGLEKPKVY